MNATEQIAELHNTFLRRGIDATREQVETMRRCSQTLSRVAEAECGDSGPHYSRCLERDDATGKPVLVIYFHNGRTTRIPVPDREAGALRRVAQVCKALGLIYYHQTDPRGVALYVGKAEWLEGRPAEQVHSSRLIAVYGGRR